MSAAQIDETRTNAPPAGAARDPQPDCPANCAPSQAPPDSLQRIGASGLRFGVLSATSAVISFGLTVALHELGGVAEEIAYAIALCTVFVTNFLGCRFFVYPGNHRPLFRQFGEFLLSSLGFRGAEWVSFVLLIHLMPYQLALVVVQAASFVAKFFFYRSRVFRPLTEDP